MALPVEEMAAYAPENQPSVLEVAALLLRKRRILLGLPLLCAVIGLAASFWMTPMYTATTSFLPESGRDAPTLPGGVAGLAAQFGVGGLSGGSDSPEFYVQVLESRTIRDQLLNSEVVAAGRFESPRADRVLDFLIPEEGSESERLERGRLALSSIVSTRNDRETGIVTVTVESDDPMLSAAIADRLVELLGVFNLSTRQSQSRERRVFAEERVRDARSELEADENALQAFLEGNRDFSNSPELQVQYERLQRQVGLKQEVLLSLVRQFEEARIQEVDSTPVISVIDPAVPPVAPSKPRRSVIVLVSGFLGGFVALTLVFFQRMFERSRAAGDPAYGEYAAQWKDLRRELFGVLRLRRREATDER